MEQRAQPDQDLPGLSPQNPSGWFAGVQTCSSAAPKVVLTLPPSPGCSKLPHRGESLEPVGAFVDLQR